MQLVYSWLERYALWASFIVAWAATVLSLVLSEFLGFEPCSLCWYQRIAMYPLALLLGIAAVRRDYGVYVYALPLAAAGWLLALYHYLLQKTYLVTNVIPCTSTVPCEVAQLNWFGFITIPFLSLIAFSLIIGFLLYIRFSKMKNV